MEYAIEGTNLRKAYGEVLAVDMLNLAIAKGEVFGLLGPNGAGKTTTILMLTGLTEPTDGSCKIHGHDPLREPLIVKRLVGYLPERPGLYEDLTGEQNLRFVAKLNSIKEEDYTIRITNLLKEVGLADVGGKKVGTYSKGMKQRLGIASVLLKEPEVLVFDEPTAGVDPKGVMEILDMIVELSRNRGKTVLLSSHLLYQVQRICSRVGIFVKGKMVIEGTIQKLGREVISGGKTTIEVGVHRVDKDLIEKISSIEGISSVEKSGDQLLIKCDGDLSARIAKVVVEAGYELKQIKVQEYALDEIYSRYFAGEPKAWAA